MDDHVATTLREHRVRRLHPLVRPVRDQTRIGQALGLPGGKQTTRTPFGSRRFRAAGFTKPIDLLTTLQESASKWQQVASLRNLQFEQHLDVQRLPVMGDENALRRVIDILLDNAFKYTPSPGKVTLSAKQQDNDNTNNKDGRVVLTVEDSGIGSHRRSSQKFPNASIAWTKPAAAN